MIRLMIAGVCAVALTACTSGGESAPPPSSTSSTAPSGPATRPVDTANITAAAAFGDLTEVDLCEFLRPTDLLELGETRVGTPAAFDVCAIEVVEPDNTRATVYAGHFFEVQAQPTRTPTSTVPGGVRVYAGAGGDCRTDILFPDNVGLSVWAEMDTQFTADMCPLVTRAVEGVTGRLTGGIVSTRKITPNSLARADACAAFPADLPGFDPTRQFLHTKHWCSTPRGDGKNPYASLTLAVGYAPVAEMTTVAETIDGRATVIKKFPGQQDDGAFYCFASTAHQPIEIKDLPGASEYAMVEVWLPADDRCAKAKEIATQVWPKLPR
ncbi:hypothetical protein [Alloactinosynnema sp. L-07]|uniref:hypothetical protein n=1 Tax=Alloactinosynnema sp. L-07 TaxID=1653480 RepID=UPI00065F0B58|nr:hypothetical protein [Alloactinosynnema sp. L-07]CRK58999.1 hypothetical protein [Alloactinosynnema sp. L-07]